MPPLDQVDSLVEDAGVLSPAEEGCIQDDIAQLAARQGVALHVVVVRSFDGLSGPDWTEATFDRAGSGEGDVLVAGAVDERPARPVTADRAASHGITLGQSQQIARPVTA